MSRSKPLYEGKAKILYEGSEPGTLIQHFKDDTTAFNGEKQAVLAGKGVLNNRISEFIFLKLEEIGVPTHFIKSLNMREQLVKAVEIIPVEVVVRNITAGSLAKRFDVEEGMQLPYPLIEYYLKSDKLGDPMVTEDHIRIFDWAMDEEIAEMRRLGQRISDYLTGLFAGVGIRLIDLKLEFGRIFDEEGNIYIVLADEISPDSCRLWDVKTGNKLDKDRFRRDMGGVEDAYREVARRLGIISNNEDPQTMDEEGEEGDNESTDNAETPPQKGKAISPKGKGGLTLANQNKPVKE